MSPPFEPLFRNAHLSTLAGNFWPRAIDEVHFPPTRKLYKIDDQTTIVVYEHRPAGPPRGQIIFLHGLEGSADAGYIRSFAQAALERGYVVHRKNLRTCGGTEDLSETMYHSGLTGDTRFLVDRLKGECRELPVFVAGFSLGGNVALKLAGEMGHTSSLAGAFAASTPIDLACSVRALDRPANLLYARRFVKRLKQRVTRKSRMSPGSYSLSGIEDIRSIWAFDDRFTAPLFGFETAANYYATQSAMNYLAAIRVPTLVVAAQDDPLVPFSMYSRHSAFDSNPALVLVAPEYGGHLGFLSRRPPRFWLDVTAIQWIDSIVASNYVAEGAAPARE